MAQLLIDLSNGIYTANALLPQTLTASAQGSSLDMSDCEYLTNAIVQLGAFGAGQTSITVQIEQSADGSTNWTTIGGVADQSSMVCTATTSNQQILLKGIRTQRYARANAITVTGTTPSAAASVEIVAQQKYFPTTGDGSKGYSVSPSA
jgi:hypothetical protein